MELNADNVPEMFARIALENRELLRAARWDATYNAALTAVISTRGDLEARLACNAARAYAVQTHGPEPKR